MNIIILFQSTPPVWVVTYLDFYYKHLPVISIHTTRVGGDAGADRRVNTKVWISIHTTRVGGDNPTLLMFLLDNKISIHTTRVGGDIKGNSRKQNRHISIHTTRVGGDAIG